MKKVISTGRGLEPPVIFPRVKSAPTTLLKVPLTVPLDALPVVPPDLLLLTQIEEFAPNTAVIFVKSLIPSSMPQGKVIVQFDELALEIL